MTRSLRLYAATVVLLAAAGPRCQAWTIDGVVNSVSQTSYSGYLNSSLYTTTGSNRGYGAQHDLARTAIYNAFDSIGLETTLSPFIFNSATYNNVVGVWEGTTRPDDYYVVGAHYDSVNNPGADDNASGVAGVIEAARVLSHYRFEASLVFIAFDREEQGLLGSAAWAQQHAADNILGMISLDMIAYDPLDAGQARIYSRSGATNTVTVGLTNALNSYTNLTPVFSGAIWGSDHSSFAAQGFPAALLIEASSNPNYHTQLDSTSTAGYINYGYATNMTRGAVGYLATAAELSAPEPATMLLVACGLIALAAARRRRIGS